MKNKIWEQNSVLQQDLEQIAASEQIDWEKLAGRSILITGATGLIGSLLARSLVCASQIRGLGIRVLAFVRNEEKAKTQFASYLGSGLEIVSGDVNLPIRYEGNVDYIFHTASVTASKDFVNRPVETILTTLKGTEHVLELAKKKQVSGMVYLSSMEAYGVVDEQHYNVRETDYGYIDPLQVRSSYSEGKRMAEGLCGAYAHEYQVPVCTARLAQTFGAGIAKIENRVFAQFARSIMEGSDIVLHTDGSKAHCYCYTADAVLGLLTVLLRGTPGEAYNISNQETFCSIREMAQMLIDGHPGGNTKLVFDIPEDANTFGYAPTSRMLVNSEKLNALGWKAQTDLPEMFERLMRYMDEETHRERKSYDTEA